MKPDAPNREIEIEIAIPPRTHARRGRPEDSSAPPSPRIPRITRLMALAIKFQEMIDRGEVRDYADLARLGYVSRARITQIMNLLNLAPDIQESLLLGRDLAQVRPIRETHLRCLNAVVFWPEQTRLFTVLAPNLRTTRNA